jgi:hypothetical protein
MRPTLLFYSVYRQMILLIKGKAVALNGLIGLSAHVSSYPLSRILPYFIFLLCLTPDNFTL